MKKIIGLLMLLVAFTACEGPMGPEGPQGPPGEGGGIVEGWRYKEFTVKSQDWKLSDDETYFWCEYPWDEVTDYVYEEGLAFGKLYTTVGDAETLTPLPYSIDCTDGKVVWQETYTFDYNPGWVAFYVNYSDFQMDVRPGDMKFRVSILW